MRGIKRKKIFFNFNLSLLYQIKNEPFVLLFSLVREMYKIPFRGRTAGSLTRDNNNTKGLSYQDPITFSICLLGPIYMKDLDSSVHHLYKHRSRLLCVSFPSNLSSVVFLL